MEGTGRQEAEVSEGSRLRLPEATDDANTRGNSWARIPRVFAGASAGSWRLLAHFVAPAVNPPRQYFPSRMNAAMSGKTLMNEPSAIR
jgi:hypothetical protein